ncbi:hypothetical protein [Nesterenkonia jeotgali]|uniref:Uncharacterized protein n=1 Tax=Nesterenkonia jeotgali TaxID=317018 RepID=A0A839FFG4_9MICC|nr:hypothetical protein [Nesterenkonia jeotgali]MBA8920418.1 hypothetical protein [Nesterenkonia jeotgali]
MPRKTHAKTVTLSHPEWCAQRHPDRCGREALFPSEQFHESLRKTFTAHGHPTEGGEPFTVVADWYLMDGKTYDDDPEFDGGLQVTFNDPGTDDTPAAISIGSRDLRALAKFLEAEADAYDAWRQSQDAEIHAEALRTTEERAAKESSAADVEPAPKRPEEGHTRPAAGKRYTPAITTDEWHPSFCQLARTCDAVEGATDPRHLSFAQQFKRRSNGVVGAEGGSGQELFAAVMLQLSHEPGASRPEDYTCEARFVIKNQDEGRTVGITTDSTRLRELGDWLVRCATWVDKKHEITVAEIERRHQERKTA